MAKREIERTPFGQRLFDARTQAGLKQVPAAEKIGIGQSALAELEKKGLGSSYTIVMARVYGCDAHWLATGEGSPNYRGAQEQLASSDEPSPSEWAHLNDYREASKADRARIDALAAESAEKMRALRREMMERMGLPPEAQPGAGNQIPVAPRSTVAKLSPSDKGTRQQSGGVKSINDGTAAPAKKATKNVKEK